MPLTKDPLAAAYLEGKVDGEIRRFSLTSGTTFHIGRSDKNHVVLQDDLASRNHAMMQRSEQGLFYLTDLGSSNGTFVNGARVSAPVILRPGDRIAIGNHEFSFHQEIIVQCMPVDEPDDLKSTNMLFRESLITVLVTDIRDFTGLGQRMDASKLSMVTGTFFREAGKALQERGAWAQKYIGDAVMAVWIHKHQAPQVSEMISVFDSLSHVTATAAGLQSRFELDAPILIGAGINTGLASVGNVGSIASSDYTALGDVVNKAFRLESATKQIQCGLALGEGTYDFLAGAIDSAPHFQCCNVQLKGYDEPCVAYGADLTAIPTLIDALEAAHGTHRLTAAAHDGNGMS